MILKLSAEEGREIVYGGNKDFKEILDQHEEEKTRRWSIDHYAVFKQVSTGKFFSTCFSSGATENQDESPFEYDNFAEFVEVEPVQVVVTKYVAVKDNVDKNS